MEERTSSGDEQLLDYLDGTLDARQGKDLEHAIANSPARRARLEELRVVHDFLRQRGSLENPSPNFTQRVMRNLDTFQASRFSLRNGILLLVGIVTAIGVALLLSEAGVFDSIQGAITVDTLPIKKEWIKNPIPAIPYNGKMIVNIILMVATGLSFVLLDRTILRPWFESRIQRS